MSKVALSELRPVCDPSVFAFETTADLPPFIGIIGQDRAVEAIKFGLSIESRGFNIVVAGPSGTGRTTAVREYLDAFARNHPPPDEWCYVHNFSDPYRPRALCLPAGRGSELKNGMAAMVAAAQERVPRIFESDDFVSRRDDILAGVQRQREAVFNAMAEQARTAGFLLQGNSTGFFLVPLVDGKPMDDQAFAALSSEEREKITRQRDQIMQSFREVMRREREQEAGTTERLNDLQRSIATVAVDTLLDPLFDAFRAFPDVAQYLFEVSADMVENIDDFLPQPEPEGPAPPRPSASPLRKYEVNLLVESTGLSHARVVYEANPTPQRLFGRIEKEAVFGALTTDFTMIHAGSLHQANGGYFVFDFDDILQYPMSWNELKRTIRTGLLTIEELGERAGVLETKTIRPQPIPWTGKMIGIAREHVYRGLFMSDPDFQELFKVKADFDLHIDRSTQHVRDYARLVASVTKKEDLPPFDRAAVARIVDEGVRMAEDHNQLSIRFGAITDIVREAAHWALGSESSIVRKEHVERAIRERHHRLNLSEEHLLEAIRNRVLVVDVMGGAVGQVNGLSVIDLGDTSFGQPSRITATTGVGREGVIDLQRESKLSGPIYSKAVLTLQGFLVHRYAVDAPVTLAASISFEQNYGLVEGDSATCAEVCALLSRIAEVPLAQSLAITGSMDQLGEVQAIGGVNQKIEGFFDVCHARGLTGGQGVIIPASNVQHLMLREDVVEAVSQGQFTIYSVSTIDEALELLTGIPAGQRDESGHYPPDSINGLVLARLREIGNRLRELGEYSRMGHGEALVSERRPDTELQ